MWGQSLSAVTPPVKPPTPLHKAGTGCRLRPVDLIGQGVGATMGGVGAVGASMMGASLSQRVIGKPPRSSVSVAMLLVVGLWPVCCLVPESDSWCPTRLTAQDHLVMQR